MADLTELLDQFDLAVGRAGGVLPERELTPFQQAAAEMRNRGGFLGDLLVLAIAGGTGSGKSSLLNAFAGETVASVSHLRPHTDRPLAWVPEQAGAGIGRLLDDLGIEERVTQDRFPGLCVIDLPDLDSVSEWHRTTVENLLPRIDVVVWVFDPEKYHDPVLHEAFLRPLAGYGGQFVFVLNQIDRLVASDALMVAEDLTSALEEDGYVEPRLYSVAAAPGSGDPRGIDPLTAHLSDELDIKRLGAAKLIEDVHALGRRLAARANVWSGGSVDFDARWDRVKQGAAAGVVPDAGPAAVEDALCRIEDFIAALSVETGGPFGEKLRATFPSVRIEQDVASAGTAAASAALGTADLKSKRKRAAATRSIEEAAEAVLEQRVGEPLRELLSQRAFFGAEVAVLGVAAAAAARDLSA